MDKKDLLLYAVTDRRWTGEVTLEEQVEAALKGGVTFLQLREKDLGTEEYIAQAKKIKALTDKYHVPFVIDDNIEVALAVDADGVHVGQSDLPASEVRKLIGPNKIIGVSAKTVEQALKAEAAGADYLGSGAVFETTTKPGTPTLPHETLQAICQAVSIPVVAIGGITPENLLTLKGADVAGVAIISAIFGVKDIEGRCLKLLELSRELVQA